MLFYNLSSEKTLEQLSTSESGLSKHAVEQRLKKYGKNEIVVKGEPLWKKIVEPFANIFMAVLFLAVLISIWHHAYLDAVIIVAIMLITAGIYYFQRFSTERIIRSLQKKVSQKVTVIRNGKKTSVDASDLVPGDIVVLGEGDKVPADLRLIHAESVKADEAILTGESEPLAKNTLVLKGEKEVYERTNMLFQGSFVVAGQASGVVVATGNETEFGKIAALSKKDPGSMTSPVQRKIDKLIAIIIAVVGGVAVAAFALAIYRGIELAEALRFVIALSVSAVPESLPVAISVVLALGMRRMAAKRALVRSMNAIETIGVITTIASDKTGTLTENKLSAQEIWQPEWSDHDLNRAIAMTVNTHDAKTADPLDTALGDYAKANPGKQAAGEPMAKLPFDQAFAMSGNIWHNKGEHELVVKGAPEQILDRSGLTKAQLAEAETALHQLTSQGYRVIAVATSKLKAPIDSFLELPAKQTLQFAGFVAVADTIRPAAKKAIATAQRAGVTVRMITGDHFETAFAIGRKLGLVKDKSEVFDSRLMADMSDKELAIEAHRAKIFSRVTPENKYRILQVLKLTEVTAMTGDGVNDVPALTKADVGIAMGAGAQIAKDAGDIILLDNNFSSIVRAMREGRIIFSNIRRMLVYLLTTNTGEVLTTLGALIAGAPMPLAPIQILWINLVTDTVMVIPLGLEPGEKNTMKRKPVAPKAPILSKYMIWRIAIGALVMATTALGLYAYYGARYDFEYARTIVFAALVAIQWANALNMRSTYETMFTRLRVHHPVFWIALAIAISLQMVALFGPLQDALHVSSVALYDIFIAMGIAIVAAIVPIEIHKWFGRRRQKRTS